MKLLIITCLAIIIIPSYVTGEPSDGALTRGSRFSINITGLPSTSYYVWLTRTSTMTGMPGDQPPIIVAFQRGVQQDPPDGPYTIGSYIINNGNGRTIRDDIAPSTPYLSNTNYYALVTTDSEGRAVITFQTSSSTATRTFSVKVENPRSAANSDILIERGLPAGIPTRAMQKSPVITTEITKTTMVTPGENNFTVPVVLISTPLPHPTTTPQSASEPGFCMLGLMAVFLVAKGRDYFR